MTLRALIFDVDGTLAETEELHRRAFNDAFAAAGLAWNWDEALYRDLLRVTGGKERIRHFIEARAATPALNDDAVRDLHRDKTARYTAFVEEGALGLRPGIASLISDARDAGLRLAIATTTSRENVDALIGATFRENPFDVVAAGDEVPAKKPAPDIYLLALQRLGMPASDCLAIEDSANGLRSAVAAGLKCVVTRSVYGGDGPFDGALAVFDDPDLTLETLRRLHGKA